jgi:hypothetical protein
MEVYTNILVDGVELDLVALDRQGGRTLVYVVEVKSRPKRKLLEQVLGRVGMSDYVYVALPARYYPFLLEVPPPIGSLAVELGSRAVYEIRRASYLGNGRRLLEKLRSRPLQG